MNALGWFLIIVVILLTGAIAALAWAASGRMIARRTPDARTSPADVGLHFEEITFPARDGLVLRGWFMPAPGARAAVVFCHGHNGSMDPDVQYAPWFHEMSIGVLMFDFRGHGRSDGNKVSLGLIEQQDLVGALDYLEERGIDRIGVLGFSMGGVAAILTASRDQRIAAVVSDGAFARLTEALTGWAQHIAGVPRWLARIVTWPVPMVAGWRLGARLSGLDPLGRIQYIAPRPLLLIHGDHDPYVSVQGIEALYAAAGEPKELWRVPEAAHRKVDQVRPEEYRSRVTRFFRTYLT